MPFASRYTLHHPNDQQTLFNLADIFLNDKSWHVCDVKLRSTDDICFPACSGLIMSQSKVLDRLIRPKLTKRRRGLQVNVPIKSVALQEILFYCYTKHSTIVERYAGKQYSSDVVININDFCDLVHVAVAAKVLQIRQLVAWCTDTLRRITEHVPQAYCFTLQVLLEYEMLLPDAIPKIISFIKQNPRQVFRVADCVVPKDGLMLAQTKQKDANNLVVNLSPLALGRIINGLSSGQHNEYLFQVAYFWATKGLVVRENEGSGFEKHGCEKVTRRRKQRGRNEESGDESFEEEEEEEEKGCEICERWEDGKVVAQYVDLRQMRVGFLKNYVSKSGLVNAAKLCDVFSEFAMKAAGRMQEVMKKEVKKEDAVCLIDKAVGRCAAEGKRVRDAGESREAVVGKRRRTEGYKRGQ